MKYFQKIIYVILYLIFLSNYAYTKSNMNKKIERIAVFEFENNRLDKEIAKTLTDRLRNELVQFDEIEIVERKRIDAVFQEQKIQISGCADECLIEVGKILGSSSIIVGSIGKVGNYFTINARKINATTAKVESAISYDSYSDIDQLLIKGMSEVAFKIVKGYNPPKPLIEDVEPKPDLNKKYTFNNAILTGIWGTFGAITCATLYLMFSIISNINF